MPVRQITHTKDGLIAVFRQKTGADVLDAPIIHYALAEHIRKQIKTPSGGKIPDRFWGRILFVANIIQQTVSLDGDDRFDIPGIDAPSEDITDFYEFMMTLSESQIDFFRDGLRKLDPVPNSDGEKNALASTNGSMETRDKSLTPA